LLEPIMTRNGRLEEETAVPLRWQPAHEHSVPPPLVEEIAPAPDPADALRHLAGLPYALLLDSALRHSTLGRYSFLTADPFEWLRARGERTILSGSSRPLMGVNPLQVLADRLGQFRAEPIAELPPFQGGAAGLFGYDLCHHIERLPRPRCDEFEVPDLALGFYDWVLAFDHERGRAWLISTGFPELDPHRRRRRAERRLRAVRGWLRGLAPTRDPSWAGGPVTSLCPQWSVPGLAGVTSNFSRPAYLDTVRRAIEYVHAGDCFQVNVAQRLLHPATIPPLELYLRLRARNAAPFAGYFDLGDFVLASASPERFVRVQQSEVETRPIKGTRPRGATPAEDQARLAELLASAKDRAENVMIVDLLRNDLGRVCRYGSVRVETVCRIETYRYVHHLVSEVRGRLRPGLGPVDLLKAAFPGGSVTGAPKVRAMEIIAELEPTARGPYCGSLGYIGFDGSADTSILIRTFTAGRGWFQFPVGGGIVADSVPEREYEETWHKAEGLLRALD
jgi:para-aminobenzoate synthetase component 1